METEAAGRIWGGEKKIIMNESYLSDGDSSAYKAGTKMNDGNGPSSNGSAGKEECESHTKEEGHKTQETENQLKEKKNKQGKLIITTSTCYYIYCCFSSSSLNHIHFVFDADVSWNKT